jgi:hypothetical protein
LRPRVATALIRLRQANSLHQLPRALLTAALYHGTLGADPEEARRVLAEAQQIAERGPMPLHLADVHLHRARLFRARPALAEARALIDRHGYGRRRSLVSGEKIDGSEITDVTAARTLNGQQFLAFFFDPHRCLLGHSPTRRQAQTLFPPKVNKLLKTSGRGMDLCCFGGMMYMRSRGAFRGKMDSPFDRRTMAWRQRVR